MSFDPYEVLQIPEDADHATIRRAYQRLARRHHPDLSPGDPVAVQRYRQLVRAYRLLTGVERSSVSSRVATRAEGTSARFTYESFLEVHAEWLGFAGDEEPPLPATEGRGKDLVTEVSLELAEAVRGVITSLSIQREVPCEDCAGSGTLSSRDVPSSRGPSSSGPSSSARREVRCQRCGGTGILVELDRLRVRIPRGVDDGTRLRLPGRGEAAAGGSEGSDEEKAAGGEPGDLILVIQVRPHPYFTRHGLDTAIELPVSYREAVLGATVEVPTIDGPVRVRLPEGTSGGQRFRLRGRGVALPDGRRGDHYYTVRITVPRRRDPAFRELVARLPEERPREGLPDEPL